MQIDQSRKDKNQILDVSERNLVEGKLQKSCSSRRSVEFIGSSGLDMEEKNMKSLKLVMSTKGRDNSPT